MANEYTEIKTGVSRIVWGHPTKGRPKINMDTKQPVLKADGTPVIEWTYGIAIPKPEFMRDIWPLMASEAGKGFPNGVPNGFSWKCTDGDTIDGDGKPFAEREGYAGHFVLALTTQFQPPAMYKFVNGQYVQIGENEIKCGDYVVNSINAKVNVATQRTHNSSLYLNPVMLELVGIGTEIISAARPDPKKTFGGQQYALPPGVSMTPPAPSHGIGMPGSGQTPQGAPQMQPYQPAPMPGGYPQQMPGAPVQPAPQYQQTPMQQAPQQPYGVQPAPQMQPYQPAPSHGIGMPGSGQAPQGAPGGYPQSGGMLPPPATDFTGLPPQGAPQMQPYQPAPMPGQMPGGYPQPAPQGMQPGQQPYGVPGQFPPR